MKTVKMVEGKVQIHMSDLGWVEYNRKTLEQNKGLLKWDLEHNNITKSQYDEAIGLLDGENVEVIPVELPESVKDNVKSANFVIHENNNVYIEFEYQDSLSDKDKELLHKFIKENFLESLKYTDDKEIHEVFDKIEFRMKEVIN